MFSISYIFIGKLITENFLDWFNNIRISNNYSVNNYELILEDFNFLSLLLISFKTTFYYFYYLPSLMNYFYIYYFFEILMMSIFFIIILIALFDNTYVKNYFPNFTKDKILILILSEFILPLSFPPNEAFLDFMFPFMFEFE